MAEIAGLKLIVPSSASATGSGSSVSISATGKVTWTTAVTTSINGCFSTTYKNYLIVMRGTSTDYTIVFNMRAAGTDAVGANTYTTQRLFVSNTTTTVSRFTENFARTSVWDSNPQGTHMYLYSPALAQPTAHRSVTSAAMSGGYIADHSGTHNQSTAYDGITFGTQGGGSTFSGSLTIYGLSQ